jgi:hypothetical protein
LLLPFHYFIRCAAEFYQPFPKHQEIFLNFTTQQQKK